jgi:hypothetical protein
MSPTKKKIGCPIEEAGVELGAGVGVSVGEEVGVELGAGVAVSVGEELGAELGAGVAVSVGSRSAESARATSTLAPIAAIVD